MINCHINIFMNYSHIWAYIAIFGYENGQPPYNQKTSWYGFDNECNIREGASIRAQELQQFERRVPGMEMQETIEIEVLN